MRQTRGRSADCTAQWLNWVIRRRADGCAVGTTQATITAEGGVVTAEIAWVVASSFQGQGYAKEAAWALTEWLRGETVEKIVAHVHPEHHASQQVASATGLRATSTVIDEGVRWQG